MIDTVLISILSLYAEGDCFGICLICLIINFNPLPLCRGRQFYLLLVGIIVVISILSLYAEGDFL